MSGARNVGFHLASFPPQYILSNLVIHLFSWGGGTISGVVGNYNPPAVTETCRLNTKEFYACVRRNMCASAVSVSIANQILYLRPSKGGFPGEGGS